MKTIHKTIKPMLSDVCGLQFFLLIILGMSWLNTANAECKIEIPSEMSGRSEEITKILNCLNQENRELKNTVKGLEEDQKKLRQEMNNISQTADESLASAQQAEAAANRAAGFAMDTQKKLDEMFKKAMSEE